MEQIKIELKQVKTVKDLVEMSIANPHDPIFAFVEETENLAFVIKYLTGNYGLYSGLSGVISGGDYVRHEFHYNLDAFIVYELKGDSLTLVSINTDWGHGEYDPISGMKYVISNIGSEPEVWFTKLRESEAIAAQEKWKEPEIDVEYWINGKMNSEPVKKDERYIVANSNLSSPVTALYVYGAEFQMVPYESKEQAIYEIEKHFDSLKEEDNFNPENDEAFVMENKGIGKNMEVVYSTKENEKYQI